MEYAHQKTSANGRFVMRWGPAQHADGAMNHAAMGEPARSVLIAVGPISVYHVEMREGRHVKIKIMNVLDGQLISMGIAKIHLN